MNKFLTKLTGVVMAALSGLCLVGGVAVLAERR